MPNNGDNNDCNERRIRDLLGLVKFCLDTTSKEDASGPSINPEILDPDRRTWLQQAISSMTVDTTRQLLENLATVKETLAFMEKDPAYNVAVQKTCDALGVLTDLCEEIDYAVDFVKLDGFTIFKPLIGCSHEEMIVKACELIGALAQNNPICQSMAVQTRLLERLIDFVHIKEDQTHIKARSYALYAISSIVRSNSDVRKHFESQLDGLEVLLHLLNYQQSDTMLSAKAKSKDDNKGSSMYWWRKLRIRSVFLFRTLCAESESSSEYFYKKQAIVLITNQLSICNDIEVREHLLQALKALLLSLEQTKQAESLKLVPKLSQVIRNIENSCNDSQHHQRPAPTQGDDYDLTETITTCKEMIQLIDGTFK